MMRWSECSLEQHSSAPTIKNHSVTHFNQYLFCFGGYDGRRNHMTLLVYSIAEERWIRPHQLGSNNNNNNINNNNGPSAGTSTTTGGMIGNPRNQMESGDAIRHGHGLHGLALPGTAAMHSNAASTASLGGGSNLTLVGLGLGGAEHAGAVGGGGGPTAVSAIPASSYGMGIGMGMGIMVPAAMTASAGGVSVASCDHPIVVQGTAPPGRNGHSATLAADPDDDENGRIFIIGGWLGTGPLAASDMHVLDISNGGRHLRWYQPAVKGTPPGPCNMHSADYVSSRGEVYVFRGGNGREYLNDLHALDVDTFTWRKVETRGAVPQQRANHSSAMIGDELIVFGGWNGSERLNDIHILDTTTSTWTCPRVGGVLPHPRAGMTLTALRGRLYLFGGSGTSAKCFQDLQILDRREMAWLDVSQYDASSAGHRNHRHDMYENDDHRFRFGGSEMYDITSGSSSAQSYKIATRAASTHPYVDLQLDESSGQYNSADDPDAVVSSRPQQQGGGMQEEDLDLVDDITAADLGRRRIHQPYSSMRADWRSRDLAVRSRPMMGASGSLLINASPNPNDEDSVPTVLIHGRGPGRRAGHTATAVNRYIFIFGGSCGSDYLNDFFVLDTDPLQEAKVSEPNTLQLFERRLRHFFNDEEFSDVTFLVQGQKVYGHKMILSIVSDCFRAMFTTGFRESEAMEIEIPDCSHAAFLSFMEYIYTGALPKMDLLLMQDRDRNLSRIVEMLELADRFFLDHLKQVCETILQPVVNAESAEYLLAVAQKTNATQLQAVCEHFLRNRESSNSSGHHGGNNNQHNRRGISNHHHHHHSHNQIQQHPQQHHDNNNSYMHMARYM